MRQRAEMRKKVIKEGSPKIYIGKAMHMTQDESTRVGK